MKILVTGGGGYIGSCLLSKLPKDCEIICLDHGKHYNQLQSITGPNVKLVKGDILNEKLINENMRGVGIVLHLAGGGGNDVCMKDPAKSVMTNIHGTHLLLKKAKENSVDRFLFTSSYIAYSTFLEREMPLTEEMELSPDEFYGALKAASEHEIRDSGLEYVVFRLSNVYGYGSGFGQEWNSVIGRFIKSAYSTSEIPVYGSGKQRIDVVHIGDVCNAISTVVGNQSIRKEIFNVGSGKPTSIESIAEIVKKIFKHRLDKNINISRKHAPSGKVWPDRWISIDKIRKLGWEPKTGLEEGIADLVSRFKG